MGENSNLLRFITGIAAVAVIGVLAWNAEVPTGFGARGVAAAAQALKKPYYPTAQSPQAIQGETLRGISTTARTAFYTPRLSNKDEVVRPTYVDSYIVELSSPGLIQKTQEIKIAQGSVAAAAAIPSHTETIEREQSNFLSSLPSSVRGNNTAVQSSGNTSAGHSFTEVLNAVVLDMSEREATSVRTQAGVKKVERVQIVRTALMDSVPLIYAPAVWAGEASSTGATGRGRTIAIIDTGVDYRHADLGGCFGASCKVVGGWDFVNNDADPMDDMGHGTHVAAIAAGKGALKGVAPDASIYAYKVCNNGGGCTTDDIIAALERATDPNGDGDFSDHLDVANLSLGGPGNPDDMMSRAVDSAVVAGVVVAVAAGNSGGESTIGSPGTARKAITVAATDKSDNLAWFSSRGPVKWMDATSAQRIMAKPDVVAPGVFICAARWAQSFPSGNTNCLGDSTHVAISGTSMATPHVAGEAALLLQLHPDWSPAEIKAAIRSSAVALPYNDSIYEVGSGRIDALRASRMTRPPIAELEPLGVVKGKIMIPGIATSNTLSAYRLAYKKDEKAPPDFVTMYSANRPFVGNLYDGAFDTSTLQDGRYVIRLTVSDTMGNTSSDYAPLEIDNYAITGVGQTLGYVNGGSHEIRGFSALPVTSYRVTYGSPDGASLCSGSSMPQTESIICTADFSAIPDGAHYVYLSVLYNGSWKTDAPFKVAVVKELMDHWPKSIYGFIRGLHAVLPTGPGGAKELVVPHYQGCVPGMCWNSLLRIFGSNGVERVLWQLNNGANVPNGGLYAYAPSSHALAGNDLTRGKLFDLEGNVKAAWNYNSGDLAFGPAVLVGLVGSTSNMYVVTGNQNTGHVSVYGYNLSGQPLPGFPTAVPKGSGAYEFWGNAVASVGSADDKRLAVVTGSFDFDPATNDLLGLRMYAHTFSSSGALVQSKLLYDAGGRGVFLGGFAHPASADFGGDGKIETAIAFSIVDGALFRANRFDPNAYTTYIMLIDSSGEILAQTGAIPGLLVTDMAIGNAASGAGQEPNLVVALSDTWATYGQGYQIMRFDASLQTIFQKSVATYVADDPVTGGITIGDVTGGGQSDIAFSYRSRWYSGSDSGVAILDWSGALQRNIIIPTLGAVEDFSGLPPVLDDFNGDGLIDIILQSLHLPEGFSTFGTAYETRLFPLNLGTPYRAASVDWKTLRADDQLSGCFGCGTLAKKSASFTASPLSGTAPLSVTFSAENLSAGKYYIDYGDGTDAELLVTSTDADMYSGRISHIYTKIGTSTAVLSHAPVCPAGLSCTARLQTVASLSIVVRASDVSASSSVDIKFNNSDGPVTATVGSMLKIDWVLQNVTGCQLVQTGPSPVSTAVTAPLSVNVPVTSALIGTTVQTITCSKPGGGTVSDTATLVVPGTQPPPLSAPVTLLANGTTTLSIAAGESYTISWSSTNVTGPTCTISYERTDGQANGSFPVDANISGSGRSGLIGSYTMTCQSLQGPISKTVTITTSSSNTPVVSILADGKEDLSVPIGGSYMVSWDSKNVTAPCTISYQPNGGAVDSFGVTPNTAGQGGSGLIGWYKLTCQSAQGPVSKTVTIKNTELNAPVITSKNTDDARPGDIVTIIGKNFTDRNEILLDGVVQQIAGSLEGGTKLLFLIPANYPTGSTNHQLTIRNQNGTSNVSDIRVRP